MKHAYMIMVHKNNYVLEKLLQLIDYKDNDIYIHVDEKCKNFDYSLYKKIVKESGIYFVKNRINVVWGDFSLVEAELSLMETAFKSGKEYSYYHLLSGQDLPLIAPNELNEKCSKENKCYLDCSPVILHNDFESKKFYYRASVIHFFQKYRSSSESKIINKFITFLDRLIIGLQVYILRVDLVKWKNIKLYYGSQWASLPSDAVEYLINNKHKIYEYFKHSSFCDELYKQTILLESDVFSNRIIGNARYIDFKRSNKYGHPYIWKKSDFNELKNSECFFARKFDENVDKEIIDLLYNSIIRNH